MKPKNYRKLLDLIMNFANEHDVDKLPGLLNKIWSSAFMLGFYFQTGKVNEEIAVQNQAAILEKLNETTKTGMLSANHRVSINCSEESSNMTSMHLSGSEPIFNLFAMIMFIYGFKGIRECPGCNRLFVIKKHTAQIACTNKCRQRLYQAKQPDDKKEAEKNKRKAAYKDKILNGGN